MPRRIKHSAPRYPNQFRAWRQHRGFTQPQVAELIGSSAPYLSQIESGKVPYNQDILEALAWAYQTSPAALLHAHPETHGDVWMLFLDAMGRDETTIAAVKSMLELILKRHV